MTLRSATPDDLAAIMTLERASFPTDAWSDAMMAEELASPHGWYVVDIEAGRVVGYAGLRAPRGARDADVQTIAIAETSRGRGRGRRLLEALLAEASRRRVQEVFLEVRADNPVAQTLYASEGFAEVGRRPRYYQPDDVDAIVMRLDLAGWAAQPAAVENVAQIGAPRPEFASPDQAMRPDQADSGLSRPDFGESPDFATRDAAESPDFATRDAAESPDFATRDAADSATDRSRASAADAGVCT